MKREAGYTLQESMVVLALLATIALVTVPPFSVYLQQFRLQSDSREILAAISTARTKAMAANTRYTFTFDRTTTRYSVAGVEASAPDGNWYSAFGDANGNGLQDTDWVYGATGVALRNSTFSLNHVPDPLPNGTSVSSVPSGALNIVFNSYGQLLSSLENNCIVLQNTAEMKWCVCAQNGGVVQMYRESSGAWTAVN